MRPGGQARRASISGILGIHLTQVTPTSSVSERGGLPSNARGVRGPLRHRRSLSGLSREAALADGVYLSTLRAHPRLARAHGVVAVRELRSPNFGHGGHHLRRHARPPDDVVPGDVVRDQSEDRDQRPELAAGLGPAELSDRLGVAAHAAPGHGAPRAGSARRAGRGRRDLGERARGGARAFDRDESLGRGRGRRGGPRHRAHSDGPYPRWIRRDARGVRRRGHRAWQRRAHRWLARLHPPGGQRVSPPGDATCGETTLASELLPRVHRVVSLLKRWLLGTHHGGVSRAHLDAYLDEFTFRFNRRRSRHRGKLFFRLVQQAVTLEPVPYEQLIQRGRRR